MDTENLPPEPRDDPSFQTPPDLLTVLLGNATLLGVGYMLLRRRQLAVGSLIVSVVLVTIVAISPYVLAPRLLLSAWWAVLVVHAWRLARGAHRERTSRLATRKSLWHRRVLAAVCLLVVLFGWFRFDTWAITRDAAAAHIDGDCERAAASLRWLGPAHDLTGGSAAASLQPQQEACELLGAVLASEDPELLTLEEAFAQLSTTLEAAPGQAETVKAIVESFLAELAEIPVCKAQTTGEWLLAQEWEEPMLAAATAPGAELLPRRILDCAADTYTTGESGANAAGAVYRDFLATYPDHELATEAVGELLAKDLYCQFPAAYASAPAYEGSGVPAMRMFGIDPYAYGFPDAWEADSTEETVLVVCVEGPERGSFQETCYYEPGADQLLGPFEENAAVDFYATEFAVKAYELRTGELVADYSEEVGDPCPDELEYDYYSDLGDSVPGEYDSTYSDADVEAIFDRLID